MSPIFIAVFTILFVLSDCFPSNESDMKANMEALKKECAELNSVSLDEVMKNMKKDMPDTNPTENMMCFDKCLFEKSGMLGSDGQIKLDMAIEKLSSGDAEREALIKSTVTKCNLLGVGQTTCAAASSMIRCTFAVLKPKQ